MPSQGFMQDILYQYIRTQKQQEFDTCPSILVLRFTNVNQPFRHLRKCSVDISIKTDIIQMQKLQEFDSRASILVLRFTNQNKPSRQLRNSVDISIKNRNKEAIFEINMIKYKNNKNLIPVHQFLCRGSQIQISRPDN